MNTSKIKKGKSKTKYFSYWFLSLWKWNKNVAILAAYKYSRKLLTRALSPKILSNNLSLWLFYDWLLPLKFLSSRIFYCIISNWFFLFLRYLSFSEFDAPSWNCANEFVPIWDTLCIALYKIPKASPRTFIFQRGFLVGLYSVAYIMLKRLNFQMWRMRKELVNELGVTILTSCFYCTS